MIQKYIAYIGPIIGLALLGLCSLFFLYQLVFAKIEVPKPYHWKDEPIVLVCPGLNVEDVRSAAKVLPFPIDFIEPISFCSCYGTLEGEDAPVPDGIVEVYTGPMADGFAGRTHYKVADDGSILGACVLVPTNNQLVIAHELAHACGYAHAQESIAGCAAQGHLMSTHKEIQWDRTSGMELSCSQSEF